MGLIHDIPSCGELLARIEREAGEVLSNLGISTNASPNLTSKL
jgi:hypothetical protein